MKKNAKMVKVFGLVCLCMGIFPPLVLLYRRLLLGLAPVSPILIVVFTAFGFVGIALLVFSVHLREH